MSTDLYPTRRRAGSTYCDRYDPVVWGHESLPEFVSSEMIDRYERDGLLVLDDLFTEQEVRGAVTELDRLSQKVEDLDSEAVIREPDSAAIRSIFRVHRQSDVFARMANHPRVRTLVEYILGDEAYVMQSRINVKRAFDGACFGWHSDFETWHAEDGMPRMRAVSLSIFLTDNSSLNGPTMFVPGSHKTFVACPGETPDENYRTSLRRQQIGVPGSAEIAELADEGGLIAPSGPAGTAVLFDCNTLHASAMNMTPWPRSNLFFVFNAVSNELERPFDGSKPRPEFLAERLSSDYRRAA